MSITPEAAGLSPAYPVRTDRLDLRPHREDDLDDLLDFHSSAEVVRYVPWPVRDRGATREALQVKLGQTSLRAPGEWLVLAVELRQTGTVIGEVLLKWASAESRQGELGFAFHTAYQRKGLAAEAARAMLDLGFEGLGLHRITATCLVGNERSARLLTGLGMRQEGHLVHSVWFKGGWADQLVYGLLDTERDKDTAGSSGTAGSFVADR